jgi:hypothetical protein
MSEGINTWVCKTPSLLYKVCHYEQATFLPLPLPSTLPLDSPFPTLFALSLLPQLILLSSTGILTVSKTRHETTVGFPPLITVNSPAENC